MTQTPEEIAAAIVSDSLAACSETEMERLIVKAIREAEARGLRKAKQHRYQELRVRLGCAPDDESADMTIDQLLLRAERLIDADIRETLKREAVYLPTA